MTCSVSIATSSSFSFSSVLSASSFIHSATIQCCTNGCGSVNDPSWKNILLLTELLELFRTASALRYYKEDQTLVGFIIAFKCPTVNVLPLRLHYVQTLRNTPVRFTPLPPFMEYPLCVRKFVGIWAPPDCYKIAQW